MGLQESVEYLQDFKETGGKAKAIDERAEKFRQMIVEAGYNLNTRTTRAALLELVPSEADEEPDEDFEPANDEYSRVDAILEFVDNEKPVQVADRVTEFADLITKNGRSFTRTTCAALVVLGLDKYPG